MMRIRYGILTISDRASRREREDLSGPALAQAVTARQGLVMRQDIVPDDFDAIRNTLLQWVQGEEVDVILTTGGTGVAPRDITPEATLSIIERPVPGLVEAARAASLKITPHAMLSRGVAGIIRRTLIINLPGSPKGAVEHFDVIALVLPHAVELIQGSPSSEAGHRNPGPPDAA